MHASPLITTSSVLLLSLYYPFFHPHFCVSYSFIIYVLFTIFLITFPRPRSSSPLLVVPLPLSFLLFISRSVVNILSCAQTPA